jgi:hypothetical protein
MLSRQQVSVLTCQQHRRCCGEEENARPETIETRPRYTFDQVLLASSWSANSSSPPHHRAPQRRRALCGQFDRALDALSEGVQQAVAGQLQHVIGQLPAH